MTLIIHNQVLFREQPGAYMLVLCYTLNVLIGHKGAGGLAAVGALHAICLCKHFPVAAVKCTIKLRFVLFVQFGKELLVLLLPACRFLFQFRRIDHFIQVGCQRKDKRFSRFF